MLFLTAEGVYDYLNGWRRCFVLIRGISLWIILINKSCYNFILTAFGLFYKINIFYILYFIKDKDIR